MLYTLDGKLDGRCNSWVDQLICWKEVTEVEEKEYINKEKILIDNLHLVFTMKTRDCLQIVYALQKNTNIALAEFPSVSDRMLVW